MSWAQDEFKTLELGDQRLNARAVLLAVRLTSKPTESIPNACLGWAETQGAYRFLSNPRSDRTLPSGDKLWARLAQAPVLGSVRFELPSGRGRKARSVQQGIRTERVEIGDRAGGTLSVTCVLARKCC